MAKKRQRWSVFFPEIGTYIASLKGGVAWTSDLKEAKQMATTWGPGVIVDNKDFANNWYTYCMIAILGGIMPRKIAKKKYPYILDLI